MEQQINKSYKDLEVWKCSKGLVKVVYAATHTFPTHEQFCLTPQIRRAAISIPSNIAEGIGRKTSKNIVQFLFVSRGSLYELETQMIIANELGYISEELMESLLLEIERTRRLLYGLINYYESKSK